MGPGFAFRRLRKALLCAFGSAAGVRAGCVEELAPARQSAMRSLPEVLMEARAWRKPNLVTQALLYWVGGYHFNRGNEEAGESAVAAAHRPRMSSTAIDAFTAWMARPRMMQIEQEHPLTPEDLEFIRQFNGGPLELVDSLLERCVKDDSP